MSPQSREPDRSDESVTPDHSAALPASIVPRWLALLVLIALLGAAGLSVHAVLTAPPLATERSAEPAP